MLSPKRALCSQFQVALSVPHRPFLALAQGPQRGFTPVATVKVNLWPGGKAWEARAAASAAASAALVEGEGRTAGLSQKAAA